MSPGICMSLDIFVSLGNFVSAADAKDVSASAPDATVATRPEARTICLERFMMIPSTKKFRLGTCRPSLASLHAQRRRRRSKRHTLKEMAHLREPDQLRRELKDAGAPYADRSMCRYCARIQPTAGGSGPRNATR